MYIYYMGTCNKGATCRYMYIYIYIIWEHAIRELCMYYMGTWLLTHAIRELGSLAGQSLSGEGSLERAISGQQD